MSWFDKWRAQKAPTAIERATVHILDVARPERREFWQIGKDVGRDLYERHKAPNDHLYAFIKLYGRGAQNKFGNQKQLGSP
jgi:hypothetical protein